LIIPAANKLKPKPASRLRVGKNLEMRIKNPIKYKNGNLTRSIKESFTFDPRSTAIFNNFIRKKRFIADQPAPTKNPSIKRQELTI
jgi:hypothetical protein